ncbi:hypothetical protein [Glaciecola petra]|uniref:HNH domain-containing protein n=1 Tax=Glaciecola petra TaxID=3075602 RepID=A0ABU2ZR14_9ALTE|nr:hypothetical protein [Aestuariibacter sp. P117]MDT0595075.1 hypothetical protein [Aestuariibacter sp. P117]
MSENFMTHKYPRRSRFGTCPLCSREVDLTFHHLIPKKMHRRTFFKKHFTKKELAAGIDICRLCHTGLHKNYTEMQLAKHFFNVERIKADKQLQTHFLWVNKQKVGKS